MQTTKKITGRIFPGARHEMQKIIEQAEQANFPGAVLCLLKIRTGRIEGGVEIMESEEKWTLGVYGPENIRTVEPQLAEYGHGLLYQIEDVVIAIPQFGLLEEITGKEMDFESGEIVFRD